MNRAWTIAALLPETREKKKKKNEMWIHKRKRNFSPIQMGTLRQGFSQVGLSRVFAKFRLNMTISSLKERNPQLTCLACQIEPH